MAIKIFFKHLFTSIRRRPAQPVLLMLIVAIAVMVGILALELESMIIGEQQAYFDACNGNSNIIITVESTDNRFLDPDMAYELLGDDAEVCGIYALPFYDENDQLVKGVHTELNIVGNVFKELDFVEVKNLQGNALNRSIVVTKAFAESHNLAVDDHIVLKLLGNEHEYKVRVITDDKIMGSYEVMVDADSTLQTLTGSGMYSSLVKPFGKILIHSYAEEDDLDDVIMALDELYDHGDVNLNALSIDVIKDNMGVVLTMLVILVIFLAVATLYCCFSILTSQRVEENALFAAVGSSPRLLNMISMAEMGIYWFIGSAAGIGLAVPMLKLMGIIAKYEYIEPALEVLPALEAAGIMLLATECSMMIFIAINKFKKMRQKSALEKKKDQASDVIATKQSKRTKNIVALALTVLFIVFLVCSVTVRCYLRRIFGLIGVVVGLVTMFINGGFLFKKLSEFLSGKQWFSVPVRYGIKNSGRVSSQANVASLFSVIVMILVVMAILAASCVGQSEMMANLVDADYVALNTTDITKEHIRDLDCVESVNDALILFEEGCFYPEDMTFEERPESYDDESNPDLLERKTRGMDEYLVLAATDVSIFNEAFGLDVETHTPHGREIYVGDVNLLRYEVEVGDKLSFYYGGEWITDLTIAGTFTASDNYIIIDAEALGIKYNFTTIKGKEGYSDEEIYDAIFDACKTDNVVVTQPTDLMDVKIKEFEAFNVCIFILLGVMFVFACIGIADSVISGYRSRKEEFDCYVAAGMNQRSLKTMKTAETIYSFAVGLLVFAVMIGLEILLVYEVMLSFDANLFYSI